MRQDTQHCDTEYNDTQYNGKIATFTETLWYSGPPLIILLCCRNAEYRYAVFHNKMPY